MNQLPDDKQGQEKGVVEAFASGFNESYQPHKVEVVRQLPEYDHDFLATHDGREIEIQVAELVERSFLFPMTQAEYDDGRWHEAVQKDPDALPMRVDTEKRDQALADLIAHKARRYAPSQGLGVWLVVFSTFQYYTEWWEQGALRTSEALRRARSLLEGLSSNPFQNVWFTDMQSRPILIWPNEEVDKDDAPRRD